MVGFCKEDIRVFVPFRRMNYCREVKKKKVSSSAPGSTKIPNGESVESRD